MPKEGPQTDMLEVQRPTHEASDHWKQKVLGDADSLFRDLDALFFDSWARPGVDLQPEITSICDKWKQKQLSSEEVQSPQMDIWLQSLLDELQKVVQSEAGTADGRIQGEANIWKLQPQIADGWRLHCGAPISISTSKTHQVSRKSAEKKGDMMPKKSPQTDMPEVQRPAHEASDHWKQKVLGDADSLFRDLDALFFDSWARPGVDLQPEIASICDKWKQKQLSSEEVQSPQMDIWLQSLLDELQKVGCGAESLFQDLDSLFSDSWARPGVDLKPEMA
ncbi:USP domain-containing protein [Durusdinium trenchii]|uniref:USP domain-containing protein n=1 Tax=Durusdinium trenchii TaxID=1381693 RepID=A0ABP0HNS9_9DINO